jgi:hypothetical protein
LYASIQTVPKKRKRTSLTRKLLLFILTPVIIWLTAFVIWFRWIEITAFFRHSEFRPKVAATPERGLDKSDTATNPADKPSRETLFEEDRKKLDEIIERRRR